MSNTGKGARSSARVKVVFKGHVPLVNRDYRILREGKYLHIERTFKDEPKQWHREATVVGVAENCEEILKRHVAGGDDVVYIYPPQSVGEQRPIHDEIEFLLMEFVSDMWGKPGGDKVIAEHFKELRAEGALAAYKISLAAAAARWNLDPAAIDKMVHTPAFQQLVAAEFLFELAANFPNYKMARALTIHQFWLTRVEGEAG